MKPTAVGVLPEPTPTQGWGYIFYIFQKGGGNTFCLCRIQSPAAGLNAPIWNTEYDRKTIFLKLGEISEKG